MALPFGAHYRIKTYQSGKKIRLTVSDSGRILESTPVLKRTRRTKVGRRLARRRRRIGV